MLLRVCRRLHAAVIFVGCVKVPLRGFVRACKALATPVWRIH